MQKLLNASSFFCEWCRSEATRTIKSRFSSQMGAAFELDINNQFDPFFLSTALHHLQGGGNETLYVMWAFGIGPHRADLASDFDSVFWGEAEVKVSWTLKNYSFEFVEEVVRVVMWIRSVSSLFLDDLRSTSSFFIFIARHKVFWLTVEDRDFIFEPLRTIKTFHKSHQAFYNLIPRYNQ